MPNFHTKPNLFIEKICRSGVLSRDELENFRLLSSKQFKKSWKNMMQESKLDIELEVCVGFWAFISSDKMKQVIMKMLQQLFKPRFICASFIQDQRFECCMIVHGCDFSRLKHSCNKHKLASQLCKGVIYDKNKDPNVSMCTSDVMETLLLNSLNLFKISPGCFVFDRYMSSSMVSCIDRIDRGCGLEGSLYANRNRDLHELYREKLKNMHEQASAQLLTGRDLNLTNFASLYESYTSLDNELLAAREKIEELTRIQCQQSTMMRQWQDRRTRESENIHCTIQALWHLNLISRFAWNHLKNINRSIQDRQDNNMID